MLGITEFLKIIYILSVFIGFLQVDSLNLQRSIRSLSLLLLSLAVSEWNVRLCVAWLGPTAGRKSGKGLEIPFEMDRGVFVVGASCN